MATAGRDAGSTLFRQRLVPSSTQTLNIQVLESKLSVKILSSTPESFWLDVVLFHAGDGVWLLGIAILVEIAHERGPAG